MNHSCEDIRIPISWGTLSGKLWIPNFPSSPTPSHHQSGILALHGFFDNAASFDLLIPYLPPHDTILALDLPGHGFSDHYHEKVSYQYFELLSDVIEVLKYLSWELVTLIGHSFGGLLALTLAAILNDRVKMLIIIDGMYIYSDLRDEKMKKDMAKLYEGNSKGLNPGLSKIYSSREDVIQRIMDAHNISRNSAGILSTRGCKPVDGGFVLTRDPRLKGLERLFYNRDMFIKFKGQSIYDKLVMPTILISPSESRFNMYDRMKNDFLKLASTTKIVFVRGDHSVHINDPGEVGMCLRRYIPQKPFVSSKL